MDPHRLAEERSIAMHGAIADMVRADPACLARARQRVEGWRDDPLVANDYVQAWKKLLSLSIPELCMALIDPSERARALRQVSPFAGYLKPRERWQIWRSVRDQLTT